MNPSYRSIFSSCHSLVNTTRNSVTAQFLHSMGEPIVSISTGILRGKKCKNIDNGDFYSFQGIPYAKPPVGHLRFKAPQPAEHWSGIRDATQEGQECFGKHPVLKTLIGGEDCLFLNVFTPSLKNSSGLRPVMVWIHGGGFTSGSSSSEIYGPEFLMTEDIVLVTINYRTGVLGFLSMEEPSLDISGNAGLKDMVLALKWVQKNIKNFNGDPNNVTIFGESAGGAAAHYLILSTLTKGLFHKAILQSGCALNLWAIGKPYAIELGKKLGLQTTDERKIFEVIKDLPIEQIYKAAEKLPDDLIACVERLHGPVIEKPSKDAFLTQHPLDILKSGKYNHVPIMIGFTNREGMLTEILQKPKPFKPITDFELAVPSFLKLQRGSDLSKMVAKHIKNFYYGEEEPSAQNKDNFYLMETDNFFLRELIRTVNYHVENSSAPVYLYRMSIETSLNIMKIINEITEPGVSHADDIGYLFKNLITPDLVPGSDEETAVRRFIKLWTNFAKYSDPNSRKKDKHINVKWYPVTKHKMNYLDIGKQLTTGVNPEEKRMTFWRKMLQINHISKL